MKTYLVGGAVRDELLGIPYNEKDWVVVGSTPDELLALNYEQVGKDFPVFLHPKTHEEYALARTEKKAGHGYHGFDVHYDPDVTLEQDLLRRDLTINAIAKDNNGKLIDPYNGVEDLNNRILRHVSNAFIEDPLRVLRVARFHAKLHHLGFSIAEQTFTLLKEISISGELKLLAAERVWTELQKGLATQAPDIFIKTLYQCGALTELIPELDKLYHLSDNLKDAEPVIGKRIENALEHAAKRNLSIRIRWAIICHALENNLRPKNLVAKVIINPQRETSNTVLLNQRLKVPNDFTRVSELGSYLIDIIIQANKANPNRTVELLDSCDAWRRPDHFNDILLMAECLISSDSNNNEAYASLTFLRQAHEICKGVSAKEFIDNGLAGPEVGEAIFNARKVIVSGLK